jgi:rubrerythrin
MKQAENILVSRYSAAELSGALLLGKYARATKDNYLRQQLTWQCSEEAHHALMWTKVLRDKNLPLLEIHEKNEYFSFASELKNEIEFLVWAHVYELRADFHLSVHVKLQSIDPDFKKVMEQVMAEEEKHLDWISGYLEKLQKAGNTEITNYIQKWGDIENRTYMAFIDKLLLLEDQYFQEL